MRPGFVFNDSSAPLPTGEAMSPAAHETWRSPVPYLFGGIAAMLGLITFALLILVCSYWKLSGYVESADSTEHMSETANSGDGGRAMGVPQEKPAAVMEERFVVIMAGDDRKIFLAHPIRSKASTLTACGGQEQTSAAVVMDKSGGECCKEAGGETHDHV